MKKRTLVLIVAVLTAGYALTNYLSVGETYSNAMRGVFDEALAEVGIESPLPADSSSAA